MIDPNDIVWCGVRVGDMTRESLIRFISQLDMQIAAMGKVLAASSDAGTAVVERLAEKPTCAACRDSQQIVTSTRIDTRAGPMIAKRAIACPNCDPAGHVHKQLVIDQLPEPQITRDNFNQVLDDVAQELNEEPQPGE